MGREKTPNLSRSSEPILLKMYSAKLLFFLRLQ
nr:MAG TPA: hypothetical protein [Caudoviricetes sp.]